MIKICFDIKLEITGPLLHAATGLGPFGLDAYMDRTRDDRLRIRRTHVSARLRDAWSELSQLSKLIAPTYDIFGTAFGGVTHWLGEPHSGSPSSQSVAAGTSVSPMQQRRAALVFSDFLTDERCPEHSARTRIRIDEHRHSVAKGALFTIDGGVASGKDVTFKGTASTWVEGNKQSEDLLEALELGFRSITALGGLVNIGFGRVKSATVTARDLKCDPDATESSSGEAESSEATAPPTVSHQGASDSLSIGLVLRFDRPLCIAKPNTRGNVFESQEDIPGGVLKGALASTWRQAMGKSPSSNLQSNGTALSGGNSIEAGFDSQRKELCEAFADLRFLYAFPGCKSSTTRPSVAPLSLSAARCKERLVDLALCVDPVLLEGTAPTFQPDWKDQEWAAYRALCGRARVRREVTVRTAIDRSKRAKLEGNLFVYECVTPSKSLVWFTAIDFSRVKAGGADVAKVREQLESLLEMLGGFEYVSKTKAIGTIEEVLPEAHPSHLKQKELHQDTLGSTVIVTLQTPTLLLDGRSLNLTQNDLHKRYSRILRKLSGKSLKLSHYFATESLYGGDYFFHRFLKPYGQPYHPLLVTDPGSVFVLDVVAGKETEALSILQGWRSSGLDLPSWVHEAFPDSPVPNGESAKASWRTCPLVPENGHGEVAVQLELHQTLRPSESETTPIPWHAKSRDSDEQLGDHGRDDA